MISHGSKKDGQRDKHTAEYFKGIRREDTMGSFGLSSTTLLHLSHIDDRDASHFTRMIIEQEDLQGKRKLLILERL